MEIYTSPYIHIGIYVYVILKKKKKKVIDGYTTVLGTSKCNECNLFYNIVRLFHYCRYYEIICGTFFRFVFYLRTYLLFDH